MYPSEDMNVETIELERFKYALYTTITDEFLGEYASEIDLELQDNSYALPHTFVARMTIRSVGRMLEPKEVRYPTTWWDAFKEQVIPYKIRKYLKINYTTKTLTARECFSEIPIKGQKSVIYYSVE